MGIRSPWSKNMGQSPDLRMHTSDPIIARIWCGANRLHPMFLPSHMRIILPISSIFLTILPSKNPSRLSMGSKFVQSFFRYQIWPSSCAMSPSPVDTSPWRSNPSDRLSTQSLPMMPLLNACRWGYAMRSSCDVSRTHGTCGDRLSQK